MRGIRWVATISGIAILALLIMMAGRPNRSVSANERAFLLSKLSARARAAMLVIPAGTRIHIRLEDTVSTEKNFSGDHFSALLDEPVVAGKVAAPVGTRVLGTITSVTKPSAADPASLTLTIEKLSLDNKEYDVQAEPVTLVAENTVRKDSLPLVSGEPGDASMQAGKIHRNSGGYVLATQNAPLAYGPESRFAFTLSQPLQLPVYSEK